MRLGIVVDGRRRTNVRGVWAIGDCIGDPPAPKLAHVASTQGEVAVDVILGEDGYTNRSDNAPRNVFSLTGFVLKILKSVSPSPTRAIEHFQDNKNRAIRLFSSFH